MLETNLQKKCIQYLKSKNIYYANVHGGGWSGKGTPDILACINGEFVAFELKVGQNTLSPDQQIHKIRIERSGGQHFVPYTLNQFVGIIDELLKEV